MKILITGGAGFIGSHLVEHYQGKASEIVILDNLRSGKKHNLNGLEHTFVNGDILNIDLVDEAMSGVDLVFHLAAATSVPESMSKPQEYVNINVQGLLNVLESACKHGAKKLIFASSAAIYGDSPVIPKTETMTPEPKSPYAITKLDGEYYLELYRHCYGLNTASLRFFNVFGPRQDPNSAYASAVPIFTSKALTDEPITIFGDGEQTRDFIHVQDVAQAMAHIANQPDSYGSFNVGSGRSTSIADLISEIKRLTGSNSPVNHDLERPGDIKHSTADTEKIKRTGWKPVHSLSSGLGTTIAAYKS